MDTGVDFYTQGLYLSSMSKLFEQTVSNADSTEEYLIKAFNQSEYKLERLNKENLKVQNAQVPGQLIARSGGRVLDNNGEVVIDNEEIYARLLLDDSDDGVTVWVKDVNN